MTSSQSFSHDQLLELISIANCFLSDLKAKIETQIQENSINCISIQNFINGNSDYQSSDRLWLTWDIPKSDLPLNYSELDFKLKLESIKKEINSHPLGESFDVELISFNYCQNDSQEVLETCIQVDILNQFQAKQLSSLFFC